MDEKLTNASVLYLYMYVGGFEIETNYACWGKTGIFSYTVLKKPTNLFSKSAFRNMI